MINFFKKTLIIAPHSDDEIFTLPFIYSASNSFQSIDLLLIENDSRRIKEAKLSANMHSFNLIVMPDEFIFKGLFFHENINLLKDYFSKLWKNYDLILAPLMEGGHQDHDSVCASLFLSKDRKVTNTKLVLYSTYRNIKFFPWLYTCGVSIENFSNYIFSVKVQKKLFWVFLKTILFCYKSQFKTWFLLFPAILISFLNSNMGKFVAADKLTLEDMLAKIPNNPMYQIYRGLNRKDWLEYLNKSFLKE